MMAKLSYFCIVLSVISSASAQAKNSADSIPSIIRCKRTVSSGCGQDGACIFIKIIDKNPITFDLKARSYRSKIGRGKINDLWGLPDGRHSIMAISPPASKEFTFSQDWKSASGGYSCEIIDRG